MAMHVKTCKALVIQKKHKSLKIGIFRYQFMHVRIKLETSNFPNLLEVDQTDGIPDYKFKVYREGGFLEPPF